MMLLYERLLSLYLENKIQKEIILLLTEIKSVYHVKHVHGAISKQSGTQLSWVIR